jgi:prepilin-type N-terminal cleavage/methylation domain-containing protein
MRRPEVRHQESGAGSSSHGVRFMPREWLGLFRRKTQVSPVSCNLSPVTCNLFPVPSSGFTLLELLVSITIVSLLATTVLFGWRIASSALQKANIRLQRSRTVLEANHLLQEQMASMVPYQVAVPQRGAEFFFQGEPQTARFLSRYSLAGRASSGLFRIEYQIEEGTGGSKRLLLNEFPVNSREELGLLIAGAEMTPTGKVLKFLPFERGPQTVTLLEGLRECHFEYYQPPSPSVPGFWTEQWTAGPGGDLPRGMAIRVAAAAGSGDLLPVSIVAAIRDFTTRTK